MILDRNLIVSGSVGGTALAPALTGQTVTGASAVVSTDTIDLSVNRDIGAGDNKPKARLQVTTTFAGLTALRADIIVADNAALSTNVTVLGSSGDIPVADLAAGRAFVVELNARLTPPNLGRRYLGIRYTPTGTGSAGAIFGDFGWETQDGRKNHPSGFAVL
jgi:hypothetical protein